MNAGHSESGDVLVEAGTAAYRERTTGGRIQPSPAWWDLTPEQCDELFERQMAARIVERAVDPGGLSSTVRAVMIRLRLMGPES